VRRKRQVWVEPLFTEAKAWQGLSLFRLRGLGNVNMEGLFVAAGQNLKRYLAVSGWGRRHAPVAASWPARKSHGRWQPFMDDHDVLDRIQITDDARGRRRTLSTGWFITGTTSLHFSLGSVSPRNQAHYAHHHASV
jgi:hypothetical protein